MDGERERVSEEDPIVTVGRTIKRASGKTNLRLQPLAMSNNLAVCTTRAMVLMAESLWMEVMLHHRVRLNYIYIILKKRP